VRGHDAKKSAPSVKHEEEPLTWLATLATLSPRERAVSPTRRRANCSGRNRFPNLSLGRAKSDFQLSCQFVKTLFKALAILARLPAQ